MISEDVEFFPPQFTHQVTYISDEKVFSRDETIKGYKGLNIDIFLSASSLRPYASWYYSEKEEEADHIEETLKRHFGENSINLLLTFIDLITDRRVFIQHLEQESRKFKPMGKRVH